MSRAGVKVIILDVRLLDKFEIRLGSQIVEIPLRAAQSLLAYLMLNTSTPYRREQLTGLCWPDMTAAHAWHNLHQTLSRLRKAIPNQYLVADDWSLSTW